jgi:hypothetical protein
MARFEYANIAKIDSSIYYCISSTKCNTHIYSPKIVDAILFLANMQKLLGFNLTPYEGIAKTWSTII